MIIYNYKRKGRKTNSKSEPMKYKMVNKLKEVVNKLIENNFEPIEGDFHPRTVRRLSRIKVFAYSLGWGRLIQVRKGKIYPTKFLKKIVELKILKQSGKNRKLKNRREYENEHKTINNN
jgi:hypothetical protein